MRCSNDENLVIFRKAVGINYHLEYADRITIEESRKSAIGVYKIVVMTHEKKRV